MNTNTKLYVGLKGEFAGLYIAHWEVSRFVITTGRRLWGLAEAQERCQLEYGEGVDVPWFQKWGGEEPPNWMDMCLIFDVRLEGEVLEEGHFGHRGWCHWRILVTRFIEVNERSS